MNFQDRHVVVTGGTGALGAAVVDALLQAGAWCHVPYRGEQSIERSPHRGNARVSFVAVSDLADARLTRQFTSIAQLAQEQREVRIWGGIHFRNSLVVGDEMGRKIAAYLVANTMKPAR